VRRPPQRNNHNNFEEAGTAAEQPRRQSLLLVRPSPNFENDDGRGDDHGDCEEGGVVLSTSSLGRNRRLSFLGLLAPQSGGASSHLLVRMSSQPPARYGVSASSQGSTTTAINPPPPTKPKPFLSMSLLKLNAIVPAYCRALVDPDQQGGGDASQACSMLDASVATATTTWSPSSSPTAPRLPGDDQTQAKKRGDRVPSSSGSSPPFLNWLTPTSASTSQRSKNSFLSAKSALSTMSPPSSSNSAMAMEGEWDSYTAPFFLVAAADILYHDMNHCFHRRHHHEEEDSGGGDSPHAAAAAALPALSRLYLRIVDDIVRLQQILCDPLLDKPTEKETASRKAAAAPAASPGLVVPSSVQRSADAARSLSATLELLAAACRIRSQLVSLQCRLFASAASFVPSAADADAENDRDVANAGQQNENENENENAVPAQTSQPHISPSSCLADALHAVNRVLQALPATTSEARRIEDSTAPSGAQILYQATIRECHKWKYCLEAACGLDRCRCVLVSRTYRLCALPRCTGSTLVFTIDDCSNPSSAKKKAGASKALVVRALYIYIYITTIREAVDRAHTLSACLLSFVAGPLRQVLRHPLEPAQLQGLPPRAIQPPQEPAESVVPQHVRSHRVGAARVL
jgi:hypothetical protein